MKTSEFITHLEDALQEHFQAEGESLRIRTFEEVGMLTRDPGLTVRLGQRGPEFQITVTRSSNEEEP